MRFMFWNTGRQHLQTTLARLVTIHNVDVLALAECVIPDSDFLAEVQRLGSRGFDAVATRSNLRLYVRSGRGYLKLLLEGSRYTIHQWEMEAGVPIIFAAAHLPSKANSSPASIGYECVALADAIRQAESDAGHQRSVLVGDLNLNPYEDGLVAARALHSVPTRTLAAGGNRVVQGVSYPMFYNPMWNFFGDETSGPPGTFFRRGSEQISEFWNMYDQVLVRPELLPRFAFAELRILTDDGVDTLQTQQGRPSIAMASDHFPIMFQLNLEQ
ncbi:MAG TPA: endonuclease/exonuclease/phosphatase family protein [Longimicrobium sp.]|nr:endonuclease/exonuclease/phosphatase family protein [Longimicrobium sp.]